MKCIIISLNSVIDKHYYTEEFNINAENFVSRQTVFAAGKGVNVAKALNEFSVPYKLVCLLGKENSSYFDSLLKDIGLSADIVLSAGKTRENISIHAKNISETRICTNEFYATNEDCINTLSRAYEHTDCEDIVVLSGRFPEKISKSEIVGFLKKFKEKKVKLILDSVSFNSDDFEILKPFLVKPNEFEIKAFGETEKSGIEKLLSCGVEYVALSKGSKGIELYSRGERAKCTPPDIIPLSTVGAGDSSVAGFVYAFLNQMNPFEALRYAVSFGTASCLSEGGISPQKNDIEFCLKCSSVEML
ncbi:MAG: hypothetical protein E7614_00505 [Ruminococcaceae bacterium]|nr:hypothetical protein [Oscillospiraceae bacterium]